MYKESVFSSYTESGEPLVRLLSHVGNSNGLEKTAGIHPEVLKFKQMLEPEPNKTYVHILALGAGDYYGCNLNNDYFAWSALSHDCTTTPHQYLHGYKTFLNAHSFAHHVNKDPAKSYGDVILSTLNHKMKRVELVVAIDHERCERNGGASILQKIHDGQYPSTSMGCRVPYDRCSICGNKAKTRAQYCEHMKLMPGKVLDDGRKVFVYNDHPRFFDISFVFIGADRTSFVLEKIANRQGIFVPSTYGSFQEKIAMDPTGYNAEIKRLADVHYKESNRIVQEQLTAAKEGFLKKHPEVKFGAIQDQIWAKDHSSPTGKQAAQDALEDWHKTKDRIIDQVRESRKHLVDEYTTAAQKKFNMPASGGGGAGGASKGLSTLGKVGLGIGAAGILGLGAYSMYNKNKPGLSKNASKLNKSLRRGAGIKRKNTQMRIKRKVARPVSYTHLRAHET